MTTMQEVEVLRDKIVDTAPDAVRQELKDAWAIALYCAKAYFQAEGHDELLSEDQQENVTREDLFYMNLDVRYIAVAFQERVENTVRVLQHTFPVIIPREGELMNLSVVDYHVTHKEDGTVLRTLIKGAARKLNYTPKRNTVFRKINPDVCRRMITKGYGIGDVAMCTNQTVAEAIQMVYGTSMPAIATAIVEDFMQDKTIMFIASKLDLNPVQVVEILQQCGYEVHKSTDRFYWLEKREGVDHFMRPNVTTDDDFKVIDKMLSNGATTEQIGIAVGIGTLPLEERLEERKRANR